jgi:hypothetical protein
MSASSIDLALEFTSSGAWLEIGREARNGIACIRSDVWSSWRETIGSCISEWVAARPRTEVTGLVHV